MSTLSWPLTLLVLSTLKRLVVFAKIQACNFFFVHTRRKEHLKDAFKQTVACCKYDCTHHRNPLIQSVLIHLLLIHQHDLPTFFAKGNNCYEFLFAPFEYSTPGKKTLKFYGSKVFS